MISSLGEKKTVSFACLSIICTKTKKTHSLKSDPVMQTGSEDAPKEEKEMTKVGKKNTKLIGLKFHPAGEGSKHFIQSLCIILV